MKKKTASIILAKAFIKYSKCWAYILLTAFIAAFVSSSFWLFINISKQLESDVGKAVYGDYNLKVTSISAGTAIEITREKDVAKGVSYYEQTFTQDGTEITLINAPKMYLSMSTVSIVEGEFPREEGQLLVEKGYLEKLGFAQGQMLGAQVELQDKLYTVCGVSEVSTEHEKVNRSIVAIAIDNYEYNAALIKTRDGSADAFIHFLKNSYTSSCADAEFFINRNTQSASTDESDPGDMFSGILLFVIISLSSVITISNCIKILLLNAGRDIGILRALGIENKNVFTALCKIGVVVIVAANLLVFASTGIMKQVMTMIVAKLKMIDDVSSISASTPMTTILLVIVAFIIVETVTFIVQTHLLINRAALDQLKNGRKLSFKAKTVNTYRKVSKNIFFTIAKRNYQLTKRVTLWITISLVLSMTLLVSMSYYLNTLDKVEADYGDSDYCAKFVEDYSLEKDDIRERDAFLEDIENSVEGCLVNPVFEYVSSMRINKQMLGESFVDYLSSNLKYEHMLKNKIQKSFPVDIVVAGYSDARLREMAQSISEDECILCINALGLGDEESVLNDMNLDELHISDSNGLERTIKVAATINNPPSDFYSKAVGICILVPKNAFYSISGTTVPDIVTYTMKSDNTAAVISQFDNVRFASLEDLNVESKQMKRNRETLRILSIIVFLIIALASFINLLTTFLIKVRMFGKEYGILNAVGISMGRIIRAIIYEMIFIVVPVFLISAIASAGITFWISTTVGSKMFDDYSVPFGLIGTTDLFVILSLGVCVAMIAKRLMSMSASAQIKSENM